jgi:hypothetical protein
MEQFEFHYSVAIPNLGGPDIYDGADWTKMDIEDLKASSTAQRRGPPPPGGRQLRRPYSAGSFRRTLAGASAR